MKLPSTFISHKALLSCLITGLGIAHCYAAPKIKPLNFYKRGWYDMSASLPNFGKSKLAKLANQDLKSAGTDRLVGFRKDVLDQKDKPFRPVTVQWTPEYSIIEPDLISLNAMCYYDFGGAHPNRDYKTFNYMISDGKPIKFGLANLMKSRTTPQALATKLLIPKLKARGCTFVVDGTVTMLTREQADNFVVTKAGLSWIFSPYDVASYAEGDIIIKMSWEELKPHINPIGPIKRLMNPESRNSILLNDFDRVSALQGNLITLS